MWLAVYRLVPRFVLAAVLVFSGHHAAAHSEQEAGFGNGQSYFVFHDPPDPVNLKNGNFFLPVQDLFLPCYGFPIEIRRSYNSVVKKDSPFGVGWSFNYSLQISITSGDTLTVIEPDGFINVYVPVGKEKVTPAAINAILEAKKAEDARYLGQSKSASYYDKIRQKLETDKKYFERQAARYIKKKKKKSDLGKFVSRQRGTTHIVRTRKGFERQSQDGRVEVYNKGGWMVAVRDRNNNEMTFKYDRQDRLVQVRDACGQFAKLKYDSRNHIVEVQDHLLRTLSYTYDEKGRMTSSKDLEGKIVRYINDKRGRLSKVIFPNGTETRVVYNGKTGKVARQDGPGKKITTYKYGKRGKGYLWGEVKDNQGGYSKYEFFPKEYKTVHTDKDGLKTITIVTACCGKPLSITNPKGQGEFFKYDDNGNLMERSQSDGRSTLYKYEPRFNQVSSVTTPDEVTTNFRFDPRGNLTFAKNSKAEEVRLRYNSRGKIVSSTDHNDNLITFTYNNQGKPTVIKKSVVKKGKETPVGEIRLSYKPSGDMDGIRYRPEDPKIIQDVRMTLVNIMRVLGPAGISFEI